MIFCSWVTRDLHPAEGRSIGKGQYLPRSLKTANFNKAKRFAPAVLAEFNNIIEQARLRYERTACRDPTITELAHLDPLSGDQLLRQSPAVLGDLLQQLDLDPRQAPAKGSKVGPFKTVISEWAKERKGAPQGEHGLRRARCNWQQDRAKPEDRERCAAPDGRS